MEEKKEDRALTSAKPRAVAKKLFTPMMKEWQPVSPKMPVPPIEEPVPLETGNALVGETVQDDTLEEYMFTKGGEPEVFQEVQSVPQESASEVKKDAAQETGSETEDKLVKEDAVQESDNAIEDEVWEESALEPEEDFSEDFSAKIEENFAQESVSGMEDRFTQGFETEEDFTQASERDMEEELSEESEAENEFKEEYFEEDDLEDAVSEEAAFESQYLEDAELEEAENEFSEEADMADAMPEVLEPIDEEPHSRVALSDNKSGMGMGWYVVHTYSGYENKVKANIEKAIENRHLENEILEVRVPLQEVMEVKNGVEKSTQKKLFPGYVLLHMDADNNDAWYVVRNTRGVTGFVGPGSKPVPLTDEELRALDFGNEVALEYAEGDVIHVIAGVWKDTVGTIQKIDAGRQTVTINVEMFGRETPVEIHFSDIKKMWD